MSEEKKRKTRQPENVSISGQTLAPKTDNDNI